MSSAAGKCALCQKLLGNQNRKEVTTSCNHTFHRECANQRFVKGKSNDCPTCRKDSALKNALMGETMTTNEQRDSAHSKGAKNNDKTGHATPTAISKSHSSNRNTRDENEDEWECSKCSADNPSSARRCQSCDHLKQSTSSVVHSAATSAISNLNDPTLSRTPNQPSHRQHHSTVVPKDNREEHTITTSQRQDKQENNQWVCNQCDYVNRSSDTICKECKGPKKLEITKGHVPQQSNKLLPPVRRSSISSSFASTSVSKMYPELNDDDYHSPSQLAYDRPPLPKIISTPTSSTNHASNAKSQSSKEKMVPSTFPSTSVYISYSCPNDTDDHQLANHIRNRIEKVQSIQLGDVKCYSKLGAGIIYVSSKEIKDRLIDQVEKILLYPKKGNHFISFVETFEFVSYIVLDVSKEKTDPIFPTAEEISHRWVELYNGQKPLACHQINSQFPNIYRLTSTSLDQLLNTLDHQDFKLKNYLARVYCCADCSFLEDLPRSITREELQSSIATATKQPHISSSSFYIQINKQAGSACIIAVDIAQEWSTLSYIYFGDKMISKKENLTCRLRVHPISPTISIQAIINHPDFAGKITDHKQSGENLILEISDRNFFDECVRRGVIRVANKHILNVDPYTVSSNPDSSEIDTETWYDTEMSKYKPDIMQFVVNPDHPIFRYKWNAKIWLQQFEQTTSQKFSADFPKDSRGQRGTAVDELRHQLQVTVMLNTLASVRKKSYFVKDQEIKLNLNDNLKTIVYNHQSKLEKGGKMPINKPPFSKTTIHVVKDDCVFAYEDLIRKKKQPLLLNMASATSPGGGFRKGDGAQEENLFRRSDYFRSLDVDLDDFLPKRTERLRCSSDGRLEPLSVPHNMYPMEEYAAIYTSGLTFFRHSQDKGYKYMDKPIENVCAIAMAAYRDPKLDGKFLSSKYATGTRKKIENIFSIAYHHKHDSLVLSALGCGAFHNPPIHVAQLFYSVIEQYAGFFETIVFAIIDDHNAGQKLNPEGNYQPFVDILDGKIVYSLTLMNKSNTMFGPYRLVSDDSTVNDVCIFDLTPCHYGAKCTDISNANHIRQYSHPPLCTNAAIKGKCDSTNDIVHMASFIHRNQCQYGGECRKIDDKKHAQELEHPSYCSQKGACQDMEQDHLKQFRHLPLCDQGQKCMVYQKHSKAHCDQFRHCQKRCSYGNYCGNFHDKKHISEWQHPFPPPCPRTPFHCPYYTALSEANDTRAISSVDVQQHCLDFAHVCRFGRNCKDNTQLHQEKSIHIIRKLCPYDGKCNKLHQEEHLNSFTHSNMADIRRVCKHGDKCHERRKLDHTAKFRHARFDEDSGIVRFYGLNTNINFVSNQCNSILRVLNYVKSQNWKPLPSNIVPSEILDWFRTVQPVHRCNPIIFESILLHGHVMSRDYMEHLKKAKFVANSVMQHSRIHRIDSLKIPQYAQHARDYITAIVNAEFDRANFPPSDATPGGGATPPSKPIHRPASASHDNIIKSKAKTLSSTMAPNDLDAIKKKAIEIAEASIKLHSNPAGIGHAPDKALGTDKHVFSILGPHQGHYYGDVFIVFKRDILHHPDADFSIQAATSFASGKAYRWRPWLGTAPNTMEERIELYHNSKLHASVPGYETAIALELMAVTSNEFNLKSMDIDLQTIFKRWVQVDSHSNIEAHLPQLIPLDYIDHIYIPQNIFDSLNSEAHRAIKAVFKHCITITQHQGVAEQEFGPFGPLPTIQERADYQTYVVGELLKGYTRDIHSPPARIIQGTVMTIPGTSFNETFVLPLTISQAHDQYSISHEKPPSENIAYIYWQAMNGDMMLVLSNEPIDADKDQTKLRHLICYIASKCESYDNSYQEQATYLNCGQPIQHHAFIAKNQYRAKSNTFHIGCNTDEFITYCLEIHRSSGKIILRQAGSNAIYNHEELSCQFTKQELDVTKLEHIHITANTKSVPVRNLVVCFEKQMELHPTFDVEFKKKISPVSPMSANENPSPSLIPCRDNVNCLMQYGAGPTGTAHKSKFSHPCRFSELCRNKEPYLTHDPHPSPDCDRGKDCDKLTDPFHRADYRHTNLPDFLIPCRNQQKCSDKSSEHRIKYSHGEQILGKGAATGSSDTPKADHRTPCKWGLQCKTIADASHRAKYSHGEQVFGKGTANGFSDTTTADHRTPCKWGLQCKTIADASHRAKYSHNKSD